MVRVEIRSGTVTLREYYWQLVEGQEAAHGAGYCAHHYEIDAAALECRSYAEVGVNQGATLACALLAGFAEVTGVDIAPENWRPYGHLFREMPAFRGVYPQDHLAPLPFAPDFLLLDCAHTVAGLRAELEAHGPTARKYILIHDTGTFSELHREACRWAALHGLTMAGWSMKGAGHTLLKR